MNYYNEEPQYEPTQFEIEINELVQEEVTRRIEGTVNELKIFKRDCEELRKKLYETRNELSKYKNTSENILKQALKEKELEIKREFGIGFAVNDRVYYINSKSTTTKCEKCNGKGKVEVEVLNKITEVKCPHCSYGNIYHYNYFPQKDIISSIRFWISRKDSYDKSSSGVLKEKWDIEIWLDKKDSGISRDSLYKTLEECQKVCDEKNNKEEYNQ